MKLYWLNKLSVLWRDWKNSYIFNMYRRIRRNPSTAFHIPHYRLRWIFARWWIDTPLMVEREALPTSRRISRRQMILLTVLALKRGVCFLCNQRPNLGRHQFRRATFRIQRLEYRKLYKQRLWFSHSLSSDSSAVDNQTAPTPVTQKKWHFRFANNFGIVSIPFGFISPDYRDM